MKRSIIFAATMALTVMLYCTQSFAQSSSGIAADKQKQANLEKNKAHQKEMQKKYNALSPQEKAAAEKRANEYKKSGGKTTTGKGTTTKPATPAKPAVSSSKSTQAKPAATNAKPAPVFMDANGKPLNNSATPAIPATPAAKTTPKPTPLKTTAPVVEPASEKVNK